MDAALEKGDLKFTLDGYKLKGSWVLVRTRRPATASGGGDGRAAGCSSSTATSGPATLDIAEFAPRSVKSDGDFEDILAADNPDIWVSNRPAKGGETGAMLDKIVAQAMQMRARESGGGTRDSGVGIRESGAGLGIRKRGTRKARAAKAKTPKATTAKKSAIRRAKPKTKR